MDPQLTWFGHDAFVLEGQELRLYIDPFKLPANPAPADIVLLTHEHFDHCSPEDLAKIMTPATDVVMPALCASVVTSGRPHIVQAGDRVTIRGVTIEAVPAYNTNKKFHPAGEDRVGFVVTIDGQRIYHAGDTDLIPEMESLKNINIALLPVSGTYVMTAEEAAEAAKRIKPNIAIPMHYGSIIGTRDDAERFKRLMPKGIEVQILEQAAA